MNCNGCSYYRDDDNYSNWGKCTYTDKSVKNMQPVKGCTHYDVEDDDE